MTFRYYGNWGGPGHDGFHRRDGKVVYKDGEPQMDPDKKPKDDLDACFYRHDVVYQKFEDGLVTRLDVLKADLQLIWEVLNLQQNSPGFPTDPNAPAYIAGVYAAFAGKITLYDIQTLTFEKYCRIAYGKEGFWGGFYNRLNREGTIQAFQANFKSAQTTRRVDPLILDLDGDGVETTNVKAGAYFDHDNNGFAEQTGWASSDDGLLVMDRNSNGTIDTGTELFGDQTILQNGQRATDGFQALVELDSNADGVIDTNDTAFSSLRIWQDIDGDGYSASDELFTLQEMGIQSINVAHTDTNILDPQGNTQIQAGTFTKTDNSTSSIGGFNLQRDVTCSIATEWLDVPDDIAALPDLQGYGNTYDLHQAMVRDTTGTLQSLIEQFIAAEDPTVRDSLMEQILFKWTGSDAIDPASRGPNFDARRLAVIEKLMGQAFVGVGCIRDTIDKLYYKRRAVV